MRVESAIIKGFRRFEDTRLSFDKSTTIIVGRNNSGKTSFIELFYKLFQSGKTDRFTIDDLSPKQRSNLKEAISTWKAAQESSGDSDTQAKQQRDNAVELLPEIRLELEFSYDEEEDSLTPLKNLILDLDPKRHDAKLICRYYIKDGKRFLQEYSESKYSDIFDFTRHRMRHFMHEYRAVDKENEDNYSVLETSLVKHALCCDFIYAQTLFDDTALDTGHGLSKGFESYYRAIANTDGTLDQLEDAVKRVSDSIDQEYETLFKAVFEDLRTFNGDHMPGLQDVKVISQFNSASLIKGSTRITYTSEAEYDLPEAHNGLGYTKLIYIVLQLVAFFEEYCLKTPIPGTHLIFIEEPEAHLHPQMQSVFIKRVTDYLKSKKDPKDWNAQLVITTHSSHIIADSGFDGIRYFDTRGDKLEVKDLAAFKDNTGNRDNESKQNDMRFLKQYMELRRCDMFFADSIILVEGTTERLLLPKMIENAAPELAHQYISVIEVGGAYALKFRELLKFLGLPTLIITDIDSGVPEGRHKKCSTSTDGAITTNTTLKRWIPKKETISELLEATDRDKFDNEGLIRVAYQIAEPSLKNVGRSFEEAFILANAKRFAESTQRIHSNKIFQDDNKDFYSEEQILKNSYDIAERIDSKSDFVFDILTLTDWTTPTYIAEGLKWLASSTK